MEQVSNNVLDTVMSFEKKEFAENYMKCYREFLEAQNAKSQEKMETCLDKLTELFIKRFRF